MRVDKPGYYRTRDGRAARVSNVTDTHVGRAAFGNIGIDGLSWNTAGKADTSKPEDDLVAYLGTMVDAVRLEEE